MKMYQPEKKIIMTVVTNGNKENNDKVHECEKVKVEAEEVKQENMDNDQKAEKTYKKENEK